MLNGYYRVKKFIVFGLAGFFLLAIAKTELIWATRFVETEATIVGLQQRCAQGGQGKTRWGDCLDAPAGASRSTVIDVTYVSPADQRQHHASLRCTTAGEATPSWFIGENLDVLAHKSEPGTISRRRCRTSTKS